MSDRGSEAVELTFVLQNINSDINERFDCGPVSCTVHMCVFGSQIPFMPRRQRHSCFIQIRLFVVFGTVVGTATKSSSKQRKVAVAHPSHSLPPIPPPLHGRSELCLREISAVTTLLLLLLLSTFYETLWKIHFSRKIGSVCT